MTFKQELDAFFGPCLRAVCVDDAGFDVFAIFIELSQSTPENIKGQLFDDSGHHFQMDITGYEQEGDQWLIHTPLRDWQFRKMIPEDIESYTKYMRGFGFDV